jgi:hypothetical protein
LVFHLIHLLINIRTFRRLRVIDGIIETGKNIATEGGTYSTRLDANIEENVGANPSGIKFGGIPHGNPTSLEGTDWLATTGMGIEAISEITSL